MNMNNEKLAFFAFSFVILAVGGPCGFLDKYLTVGNVTVTELPDNQSATTHLACMNSMCAQVSGAGNNECASDSDCVAASQPSDQSSGNSQSQNQSPPPPPPPETHMACSNERCVEVSGAGADECSTDSDCAQATTTPPPTQSTCSQYTDCSACLKTVPGECKWCIQGSICTGISDNTQTCTFGPTVEKWLTQDFQCNLATR